VKRVLITGATGFIGNHCLPLLKQRGYEVYATSSKARQTVSEGVNWVKCNLLVDNIKELLASIKPTHLLHFAWITEPGLYWKSKDNLLWLKAGIDLMEAFALHGGKRAVFSGTCAEYDWNASEFEEQMTPCLPHTLYGSSKLALQLVLDAFAKERGFSSAWGRIFYLYGAGEHSQRFVPSVINGLLQKKPVPCSHGNQLRDFLHVQDVADAFVTLLDSQLQGAVNIGSGVGVTLKQVIAKITERLGESDLIQFDALQASLHEPDHLVATTKRLQGELGWSPKFSLEEGLGHAISWWKSQR
jgi:nucleoside-diphosphate-sugar epimerase